MNLSYYYSIFQLQDKRALSAERERQKCEEEKQQRQKQENQNMAVLLLQRWWRRMLAQLRLKRGVAVVKKQTIKKKRPATAGAANKRK